MKNWSREHAFRDLFFSLPEMRENEFIPHLYQMNKEEEDEGERAPPLAMIFQDEVRRIPESLEKTKVSLVQIPGSPRFWIKRDSNE